MQLFLTIQTVFQYLVYGSFDTHAQHAIAPALIALAIEAGVMGYSEIKKAQASKKAREAMQGQTKRYKDLADWYNAEGSKDFMDTDVAKSTLGKLRDQYKNAIETNASNAARGGATEESKVANKTALNEKYNNVLQNLVGYGTQYKTNLKRDYANALGTWANSQNKMYGADVNSWQNMSNNAGSAFANTAGSTDWSSIFKTTPDDETT